MKTKSQKSKNKARILKAAREKQLITYKGTFIRLSVDFAEETCRPGKNEMIFKVLKEKDQPPKILSLIRLTTEKFPYKVIGNHRHWISAIV
jgi:hypothetical protein